MCLLNSGFEIALVAFNSLNSDKIYINYPISNKIYHGDVGSDCMGFMCQLGEIHHSDILK